MTAERRVPREPTREMLIAACRSGAFTDAQWIVADRIFRAMYDAAPAAPAMEWSDAEMLRTVEELRDIEADEQDSYWIRHAADIITKLAARAPREAPAACCYAGKVRESCCDSCPDDPQEAPAEPKPGTDPTGTVFHDLAVGYDIPYPKAPQAAPAAGPTTPNPEQTHAPADRE